MGKVGSSVGEGSLEAITSTHLYLMTFFCQLGPSSRPVVLKLLLLEVIRASLSSS